MDAGKRTINEIFNGSKILEVPFFQRAYVWKESNWERFLEDIEYVCISKEPYFMGSLILKQQMTNSDSAVGDLRLVIDGQQRLTTISILLKVLSLKTAATKKFEKRFILDEDIGGGPVLHHNRNDVDAFNRIMGLDNLVELSGSDRITEAYNYFVQNVDPAKLSFDVICNKILFVGIDLDQDDDEQQIFDTINSLGVTLTTAELLKNYFFTRSEIEFYKRDWYDIFEKDEETRFYWDREITTGRIKRTYIDLFFYSFLLIKIQDSTYGVTTEDKTRFSKLERLFESYKMFIDRYCGGDKTEILNEIRDYAVIFRNIFSSDVLNEDLTAQAGIKRINTVIFALDTATLIPYVLFVEKNITDEAAKNELYDYLEAYIMRRLVTRQTTKNYNRLFSEKLILNRILTKDDLVQVLSDIEDTGNRMPTDEEVAQAFHESLLTNKYATGVLYLIESKIRNRSMYATALLGINKYSLEHMMPKKWRNNWTLEGTAEKAEARDRTLLTLGNLTIITQSLNASIRDADWLTKKAGKGEKGGLRKYAEGIETLSAFLASDVWNEQTIYERAEYLAGKALAVWTV